jgi:hypothetical protein
MAIMRTRISLLVAALLGIIALPVRAQNTAVDSRWLAFLGCWEPLESAKSIVCVVPAGTSAVDLLTIEKGEVVSREHIAATGERTPTTSGDCTGSQIAEWSNVAVRVYLRSTETCAGAITRDGTGIIAMTGEGKGDWVYVQGVTLAGAGGQTGVRVQHFHGATGDLLLPPEVNEAPRQDLSSTMRARAAALAPLAVGDIVEAAHAVDAAVIQAWLVERQQQFVIDAKKLITLADAGVPSSVIDLIVALSYPRAFAINATARRGERIIKGVAIDTTYGMTALGQCRSFYTLDPYYDCRYGYGYSPYGYGYGPYGYGYFYDYPVIIVYQPSGGGGGGGGGTGRTHGRVINGQGYLGGSDGGTTAHPRSEPASTSGSTATPSAGSSGSSSSSSSGSSEPRTAHRRP